MGVLAWIVFSIAPIVCPMVCIKFPIVGIFVLIIWCINFFMIRFFYEALKEIFFSSDD